MSLKRSKKYMSITTFTAVFRISFHSDALSMTYPVTHCIEKDFCGWQGEGRGGGRKEECTHQTGRDPCAGVVAALHCVALRIRDVRARTSASLPRRLYTTMPAGDVAALLQSVRVFSRETLQKDPTTSTSRNHAAMPKVERTVHKNEPRHDEPGHIDPDDGKLREVTP